MKLTTLTLTEIAKIGVMLDDPYGDGIRLESVREPSEARLAALAEIAGEPVFGGEELIRDAYESRVRNPKLWTKSGKPTAWLKQRIVEIQ